MFENVVAATCTAVGSKDSVVYCSVCQVELLREEKEIAMLSHTYNSTVTPPTCTEIGYTTHTCSACEYAYNSDTVAANDYFEIERSIDGVNFVTVGYVDGAGNSNSLLNYQFADNAPEQGQLYYRLSQVDFDGTREYADKIVAVLYAGDDFGQLTIVPNPTHGLFRINVGRGMADGTVRLISQSGTVVRMFEINGCEQSLDISDLQDGVYILQYTSNSKVLQHKVVKY